MDLFFAVVFIALLVVLGVATVVSWGAMVCFLVAHIVKSVIAGFTKREPWRTALREAVEAFFLLVVFFLAAPACLIAAMVMDK